MADDAQRLDTEPPDVELPLEYRDQPPAPSPAGAAEPGAAATFEELASNEARGFGELLQNNEFRLIWGSQIFSQLADKFLVYSLLTVTYDRSGANTQEAVVLLAYTF